jgi:hypothetical protein
MARLSQDDADKALWLTLAQSWVRLAEHAARAAETALQQGPQDGEKLSIVRSPDRT